MKRKFLRYSLRSIFILTTLIAIGLAYYINHCRDQKAAVTAIRDHGGTFAIRYDAPEWVRNRFDDHEYFYNCTRVNLGPLNRGYDPARPIGDAELRSLIPHMNAFSNFHILDLRESDVTDDGLDCLRQLRFIDELSLWDTGVTDRAIQHLADLPSLENLDVRGTRITRAGAERLAAALPDCDIQSDFPTQ